MPKDSFYFKHDSNASSDIKLKAIRRKYSWKGIGWYWFIVESLRNQDNYQLPYDELSFEGLSSDMNCSLEEAKTFIDDCIHFRLFKKEDGYFFSERLKRDMAWLDEKREKTRMAGKVSAEKRYGKPSSSTSPLKGEVDIASMIEFYEQTIGRTLTPNDFEQLKDIADNYDQQAFEKAVMEAVNNKAKMPMKYIARLLENWKEEKQPVKKTQNAGMEGMTEQ